MQIWCLRACLVEILRYNNYYLYTIYSIGWMCYLYLLFYSVWLCLPPTSNDVVYPTNKRQQRFCKHYDLRLIKVLFTTCFRLVNDLFTTYLQLIYDLFTTYLRLYYDLFTTYIWNFPMTGLSSDAFSVFQNLAKIPCKTYACACLSACRTHKLLSGHWWLF